MVGYLRPLRGHFQKEDASEYKSRYCSLCRTLKREAGCPGVLILNYEMTLMLLLVESQMEEELPSMHVSCSITPLRWVRVVGYGSQMYQSAAFLCTKLAQLETRDKVLDQDKARFFYQITDNALSHSLKRNRDFDPDSFSSLEDLYNCFVFQEKSAGMIHTGFDSLVESCARIPKQMMRFLCVDSGVDSKKLCPLMESLGRWIYLMDAAEDWFDDRKKGHFNPWALDDAPADAAGVLEEIEKTVSTQVGLLEMKRHERLLQDLLLSQLPEKRSRLFKKLAARAQKEMGEKV